MVEDRTDTMKNGSVWGTSANILIDVGFLMLFWNSGR